MLAKTNRLKSAIGWKQILFDIWHLLTVLGVIYFMGYLHLPQCVHSDVSTHGRVYILGPELHKDLSTLQSPVLHLDVFTLQEPDLHLDIDN